METVDVVLEELEVFLDQEQVEEVIVKSCKLPPLILLRKGYCFSRTGSKQTDILVYVRV